MKWRKRIFISLSILVLVSLSVFLHSVGYFKGKAVGYEGGYTWGEHDGYISGRKAGYKAGYKEGQAAGYFSGLLADGCKEGEGARYLYVSLKADSKGKAIGYEDGYREGMEAALKSWGYTPYTLRDPTYGEAVAFLAEDKMNENQYVPDIYSCSHFARDVCNNAEQKGLRCAFVRIVCLDNSAHALIAFHTIDRGIVFFDPQTDMRVEPVVGKHYSHITEIRRRLPALSDDIIKDILVIW